MANVEEQTRYRAAGRVVLRRIGADQLLVPVSGPAARQNCVFPLNQTGSFIWERLHAGKTVAETASDVATAFAVSIEDALMDCRHYADALVAQQLLEVSPS